MTIRFFRFDERGEEASPFHIALKTSAELGPSESYQVFSIMLHYQPLGPHVQKW
jgi:hypothetical protein